MYTWNISDRHETEQGGANTRPWSNKDNNTIFVVSVYRLENLVYQKKRRQPQQQQRPQQASETYMMYCCSTIESHIK